MIEFFTTMVQEFTHEFLMVFHEAALYIVFGLFFAGCLHVWLPATFLKNALGKKGFRSVLKASLIGIPLPLCSCGVIPTAVSLRKEGATKGSTVSFLISTPQTGMDSIAITYALLDPLFVVLRPLISLITAVLSGLGVDLTDHSVESPDDTKKEECHTCSPKPAPRSALQQTLEVFRYAFIRMIDDLGGLLLIGIGLAALLGAILPAYFFEQYIGSTWLELFMMLLVGIPLYVCASASTPIAAALLLKGVSPGAALVFLLAGPATNVTTIMIAHKILGKKAVIIYLLTLILVTLAMGLIVNGVYHHLDIDPRAIVGKHSHVLPHSIKMLGTLTLGGLLVWMFARKWSRKTSHPAHP